MSHSPYEIVFWDRFEFPVSPEALWSDLERTDLYAGWWRWMRDLQVDGDWPEEGSALVFRAQAPIPYPLHLRTESVHSERPRVLEVRVSGGLQGRGRLELLEAAGSTIAEVTWRVEVASTRLRPVIRAARPILVAAQHWAVRVALRGFRSHLAEHRSG